MAAIGPSVVFQVELEDANDAVLSAGTFTTAIVEGKTNVPPPLVLGGVPATLDITSSAALGTIFTVGGGAQTSILTTTFKDTDGDILIGNDPFVNATGAATPVTIATANGPSITYATAAAGASFGTAGTTISLNAPSDQLEMVFSGSGVPPGSDTLTYSPASITSATYGTNTPRLGIGAVWHAPFVPLTIAPIAADVAGTATVPHSAVVTDGSSKLAVVGGSSCTVPVLPSAAAVTAIPSIAIDGSATPADANIYAVEDGSAETDFINYQLSSVNSGTCTESGSSTYSSTLGVGGIVRASAGDVVYFVANAMYTGFYPPTLEFAHSTTPTTFVGGAVDNNPVGALALNGTQSQVFACGNYNGSTNITTFEYALPFTGAPTTSEIASASTGTGQTPSCAGVAVDPTNGLIVVADIGSNVATRYASNPLSYQNSIYLTGSTVVGSQSTDFQSAAAGNWHNNEAFFINASDGVEVWNQSSPYVQQQLVALGNSGLASAITSGATVKAIAYGDDSRLWMTLSTSYVLALPTY